jgi:hypothetical protein
MTDKGADRLLPSGRSSPCCRPTLVAMKRFTAVSFMIVWLPVSAADTEWTAVTDDPREIRAPLEHREAWIREQALDGRAERFEADYGFLVDAKEIGPVEAERIANLFFYSTGALCGYFDRPQKVDATWRLAFHPGFPGGDGYPVFVDPTNGFTWQQGQDEKLDMIALVRLFFDTKSASTSGTSEVPSDTTP